MIWISIAVYFNAKNDIPSTTHHINSLITQPETTILETVVESILILLPSIIPEF